MTTAAVLSLALLAAAGAETGGSRPPVEPSFERDVRPLLKAQCFHCHGEGKKPKAGLDLRLRRFMVDAGAVVPGEPGESPLIEAVREGRMPEGEKKLTKEQIALLERWVAAGAKTLRPEPASLGRGPVITEEERSHWAFRPVRRPAAPPVKDAGRTRTPVDVFIQARLEAAALSLGPDADRRALARRVTFDLTGLPPAPEDVEAFANDPSPDAYERLVERLLASPAYGERWGRHWLDVAGYADSEGYTDDDPVREDAWRYRDYVVRALNADKPFDRFVTEQLAGDELAVPPYRDLTPERAELLTATGFLRTAPDGTGGKVDDPPAARQAVVTETVKIVASTFLGMTVGCAECHDHRYDPIPQRDFYRLRAVFEPALDTEQWRTPVQRRLSLLSDADQKRAAAVEAEAKAVEAELRAKFAELRDWVFAEELKAVPEAARAKARAAGLAFQADPRKLTAGQKKLIEDYPGLKVAPNQGVLNLFLQKYGRGKELADLVAAATKKAADIRARKPVDETVRALTEVVGRAPPATYVYERGNRDAKGETVPPGDLSVLTDAPVDFPARAPRSRTTGRRLAYARRLTDGTHPLTARVLVNRVWMHHFGRGLVATPGDFGTQGERPTHPEMLDWLADEFVRGGWSLKHLHRLIVTSTAFRQSSAATPAGQRADAGNLLLWRYPVRRLEAEAVRDAVLAAGGALDRRLYGPPVPVALDGNGQAVAGGPRRSLYVLARRTTPAYLLSVFDAPQCEPNCEVRTASTVAPQSLALMNSAFALEQAERFARRVEAAAGGDVAKQVREAWRLAYGELPPPGRANELADYVRRQAAELLGRQPAAEKDGPAAARRQALASLCQVLIESNRFLYVD